MDFNLTSGNDDLNRDKLGRSEHAELPGACGPQLLQAFRDFDFRKASKLIAIGADVNFQSENGETSLLYCAAMGLRNGVRLLVATGKCDYLIPNKQGFYACDMARLWTKDRALVRYLQLLRWQQAEERRVPAREPIGARHHLSPPGPN